MILLFSVRLDCSNIFFLICKLGTQIYLEILVFSSMSGLRALNQLPEKVKHCLLLWVLFFLFYYYHNLILLLLSLLTFFHYYFYFCLYFDFFVTHSELHHVSANMFEMIEFRYMLKKSTFFPLFFHSLSYIMSLSFFSLSLSPVLSLFQWY